MIVYPVECVFEKSIFWHVKKTFCWTIGDMAVFKCVQYFPDPMSVGCGTLFEFGNLRLNSCRNPFEEFLSLLRINGYFSPLAFPLNSSMEMALKIPGQKAVVFVKAFATVTEVSE